MKKYVKHLAAALLISTSIITAASSNGSNGTSGSNGGTTNGGGSTPQTPLQKAIDYCNPNDQSTSFHGGVYSTMGNCSAVAIGKLTISDEAFKAVNTFNYTFPSHGTTIFQFSKQNKVRDASEILKESNITSFADQDFSSIPFGSFGNNPYTVFELDTTGDEVNHQLIFWSAPSGQAYPGSSIVINSRTKTGLSNWVIFNVEGFFDNLDKLLNMPKNISIYPNGFSPDFSNELKLNVSFNPVTAELSLDSVDVIINKRTNGGYDSSSKKTVTITAKDMDKIQDTEIIIYAQPGNASDYTLSSN